ncbi:hypothetical protein ADUPG1_009781 [Aduncisulcus paluster]|uniref:RNI-like protein n=1 Tax=Aduncisulcus paluster TaxID=2918883 RepID=A0ABQ5KYY9_9EUKA|nr:hypothetical protein ADUPG1_009781 [Aduncisulcus paluster]
MDKLIDQFRLSYLENCQTFTIKPREAILAEVSNAKAKREPLVLNLYGPTLGSDRLTDLDVSVICKSLEHIDCCSGFDFSCNNITDGGAATIASFLPNSSIFKTLNLRMNNITKVGAKTLASGIAQSVSLKQFILCQNAISEEGCQHIISVLCRSSLSHLDLSYCGVNTDVFIDLSLEMMKPSFSLTHLALAGCEPLSRHGEAIQRFSQGVAHCNTIKALNLSRCNLHDWDITNLITGLLDHRPRIVHTDPDSTGSPAALQLTYLNVSGNALSFDSCASLRSFLANPSCSLETIVMDGCRIQDEGCNHLAIALCEYPHTQASSLFISLKRCGLTAQSLTSLAILCKENMSIKGDEGCNHLAIALCEYPHTQASSLFISLKRCGLTAQSLTSLAILCKENMSIKGVSVVDNLFFKGLTDEHHAPKEWKELLEERKDLITDVGVSVNEFGDYSVYHPEKSLDFTWE